MGADTELRPIPRKTIVLAADRRILMACDCVLNFPNRDARLYAGFGWGRVGWGLRDTLMVE
jgi:hypothetical protein